MARNTIKRKSEGALPPTKHRKTTPPSPSTPKDKQASNELFIRSPSAAANRPMKRGRKSEPVWKTKADDEYAVDAGRTESSTFIELIKFEQGKKARLGRENRAFLERYEGWVREREGELRGALAEGVESAATRDREFLESFKAAYAASRGNASVSGPGESECPPARDFALLHAKSKEITATAFALVAKFEDVAKRVGELDTKALLENNWAEEDDTFAGILADGLRVSLDRYRRMLHARKEAVLEGDDRDAEQLLLDRGKARVKGAWGKVARKQEKAFGKLIETVEGDA